MVILLAASSLSGAANPPTPRDPLPLELTAPTHASEGSGDGAGLQPRPHGSVPLLVASGVCLGLAGTAYALSSTWNDEFHDLNAPNVTSQEDLNDLGNRTNAAAAGAVVFGVAGGVLLLAGVYTVQF